MTASLINLEAGGRKVLLYYRGRGAVGIEDMVVVEKGGCRNLTRSPKMNLLDL